MAKKQDLRNRQAQALLCESMLRLLEKQDFDHITVNEICMEAAMSRTTFYQHYPDKYDLLVESIVRLIEPLPNQLEQDDLEGYFDKVLAVGQERHKVIRRLHQYDGTREVQYKMDSRLIAIFTQYYRVQEQRGAQFQVPVDLLAEFTCSGVNSAINYWHRSGFMLPRAVMVQFLSQKMRQSMEGTVIYPGRCD